MRRTDFENAIDAIGCELLSIRYRYNTGGKVISAFGQVPSTLTYIMWDENGRAFEGHHMKNVKHYPEHQGKWQNIQFLSRKEHRQAHNNNFRNKTNGMYDFKTGKTKDFGNKGYERPSEINLSNKVSANEIAATKSRLSAEKSRNKSISAEKISSGRTAAAKSAGTSAKTPAGHAPGISQGASRGGVSHSGKGTGHGR